MKYISDEIYHFSEDQEFYRGKVRDVYYVGDKIVMVASNRISAFDHVLPRQIPYKGQVLNQTAAYFLKSTSDIVPNWLEDAPHPNVSIGLRCKPIPIEMVIRGYLAGHAARQYRKGLREICGVPLSEGLTEGQQLPTPIITPTTKAPDGQHDMDISKEEILSQGIVSGDQYAQLERYTCDLYERGCQMADERGLILVDTKYEFGIYNDQIYLMDEVHTPDSSRYYIQDGYNERLENGEPQIQLSKEFVREWLIDKGFQGRDGDQMPVMPDEFVNDVTKKYIQLYEFITDRPFKKSDVPIDPKVIVGLLQ